MARTKDFDKEEVLAKAVSIFWQKGYNGTSMQDLVDGLEISRSSLYTTFGDKHALFIKALNWYCASEAIKRRHIIDHSGSAREAISKLLELSTQEMIGDKQHKGCFLVNTAVEIAAQDKIINKLVRQNGLEIEEAFYETIKKGQTKGEITNTTDARALARFILNSVKGIRVSMRSGPDKQFFEDIIRLSLSVLD